MRRPDFTSVSSQAEGSGQKGSRWYSKQLHNISRRSLTTLLRLMWSPTLFEFCHSLAFSQYNFSDPFKGWNCRADEMAGKKNEPNWLSVILALHSAGWWLKTQEEMNKTKSKLTYLYQFTYLLLHVNAGDKFPQSCSFHLRIHRLPTQWS